MTPVVRGVTARTRTATSAGVTTHTCPLLPAGGCIERLLHQAHQARGRVILEVAELRPGRLGETVFATNTIRLSPTLDYVRFRSTLAHELIHLIRGPVRMSQVAAEEAEVRRLTALELVPDAPYLARGVVLDADVRAVVERAGVDEDTAVAALDLPAPRRPPEA